MVVVQIYGWPPKEEVILLEAVLDDGRARIVGLLSGRLKFQVLRADGGIAVESESATLRITDSSDLRVAFSWTLPNDLTAVANGYPIADLKMVLLALTQ